MQAEVKGRIWIETTGGTYFGSGRIALLKKIRECGSITEAARALKMSYRQAWEQVELMNRQADQPLVNRVSGGLGGGGTQLTEEGERMIDLYQKISQDFYQFLKEKKLK